MTLASDFDQVAHQLRHHDSIRVVRPPSYSIWRRTISAERCRLALQLDEAERCGSPYADGLYERHFDWYLDQARHELTHIDEVIHPERRADWNRRKPIHNGQERKRPRRRPLHHLWYFLLCSWTGSEMEAGWSALHRARSLSLMVVSDEVVRYEALQMEATFNGANDIAPSDTRFAVYKALFRRVALTAPRSAVPEQEPQTHGNGNEAPATAPVEAPAPAGGRIELNDRVALRKVMDEQGEAWLIARSRVRIFRNILASGIPFLTSVLIVLGTVTWQSPRVIPLRPDPQRSDVAVVMLLGAFGGLLTSLASITTLRRFQRSYGLPLAQTLLKIPAGAATAFAGVLLLTNGVFGKINIPEWTTILSYSVVFGVVQLTVTKRIDSRAADLLGAVNSKAPVAVSTSPVPASTASEEPSGGT